MRVSEDCELCVGQESSRCVLESKCDEGECERVDGFKFATNRKWMCVGRRDRIEHS